MQPFVIPTIFTAVNQFSAPVQNMTTAMNNLGVSAARTQRVLTNFAPTLSRGTTELIGFAKSAIGVGAAIGAIAFSGKSITDYETAVASFRTIVSDLNDTDFSKFKNEIATVATDTRKSTVDVAKSFENIAGLNAKFAETAQGLGMVATAAITLAKASRMELGPASEALVGIMNQFGYGVTEASRTINVLAAGQAVGAASIQQTTDALNNFGAVASGANITLEQSVGLIQTMAKLGQIGGEAGNQLRSAIIKIQQSGSGYQSGKFSISDALTDVRNKWEALKTPIAQDAYLTDVFGLQQITAGRILVSNIDTIKTFTAQVTGTSEAQKAATINTATLAVKAEQLRDRWVTLITTNEGVGVGLTAIKGIMTLVTDNMSGLVTVTALAAGVFLAMKGYVWGATLAITAVSKGIAALNFIQGIGTAINGQYALSCFATSAGMRGMAFASFFLEASLLQLYLVTGGVLAIIGILAYAFSGTSDSASIANRSVEGVAETMAKIKKPTDEATIAMREYNKAVAEFSKQEEAKAVYNFRAAHGMGGLNYDNIMLAMQIGTGAKVAPVAKDFGLTDTSGAVQYTPYARDLEKEATNPKMQQGTTNNNDGTASNTIGAEALRQIADSTKQIADNTRGGGYNPSGGTGSASGGLMPTVTSTIGR